MKHVNVIASVILAAAVLLAAYAIGRLVRQTRMETVEPETPLVTQPNDVAISPVAPENLPGSRRRPEPTVEQRAELKAERAEKLEQMSDLTEEERLRRRDEIRQQLRSRRGEPGRVPRLSPEELEKISQRLAGMSEEERQAFLARMLGRESRVRPTVTTDANEAAADGADGSEETEPNETNQN